MTTRSHAPAPHAPEEPADRRAAEPRLQPMTVRHLRGVVEVEAATSPQPWSASVFAREIEDPRTRRYVVACRPPTRSVAERMRPAVVGFAGVQARPDAAHVTTVAVHPAAQRRGLGWRLLAWARAAAAELGAETLTLEVRAGNAAARRLYERFGFTEVGLRPGYYRRPDDDAVLMRRAVADRPEAR